MQIREAYASAHKTTKPKAGTAAASKRAGSTRPAAQTAKAPRSVSSKRTPQAETAAPAILSAEVVAQQIPVADGLVERVTSLEQQLAIVLARVAVLEQPKARFGRRSK